MLFPSFRVFLLNSPIRKNTVRTSQKAHKRHKMIEIPSRLEMDLLSSSMVPSNIFLSNIFETPISIYTLGSKNREVGPWLPRGILGYWLLELGHYRAQNTLTSRLTTATCE